MAADHKVVLYPQSMTIKRVDCAPKCLFEGAYRKLNGGNEYFDNEEVKKPGGIEEMDSIEEMNSIVNGFEMRHDSPGPIRWETVSIERFEPYQWSTMLSLFLTTFPNIETLTLDYFYWHTRALYKTLWNAVEKNRGPGDTGPTILTKLKTLVVHGGGDHFYAEAEELTCFALFPSVECLIGHEITDSGVDRPGSKSMDIDYLSLSQRSRAITELNFQESNISLQLFSQLLLDVTRLKRFTYTSGPKSFGTDPYQLIDLLRLHSKTTLEYLELNGRACARAPPPEFAGYGSLRDFESLKDVHVDFRLWTLSETHYETTQTKTGRRGSKKRIVIPLVEILPPCLETIVLKGCVRMDDVNRFLYLIQGLRQENPTIVSFTSVVRPQHYTRNHAKGLEQACAVAGIRLEWEWLP